jgi:hypothetical protein
MFIKLEKYDVVVERIKDGLEYMGVLFMELRAMVRSIQFYCYGTTYLENWFRHLISVIQLATGKRYRHYNFDRIMENKE